MRRQHSFPIRASKVGCIVYAAENKTALAMREAHGVVLERSDPDRLQIPPNVLWITTEIVMVAVDRSHAPKGARDRGADISRYLFTSLEWPVTMSPLMATWSQFWLSQQPMIFANGSGLRKMPQ